MDPFFITVGMFARTLILVIPRFTKNDIFKIGGAILVGIGAAGKAESLIALPLGFVVMVAFFYKDIILPKITEGTLLLHGLIALFIWNYIRPQFNELSDFEIVVGSGLLAFSIAVFLLCIFSMRVGFFLQVILYTFFLATNCYIAYQTSIYFLTADVSLFGQLLLGFYGLTFASSILYILNLIPIPTSKHQNFKQRFVEVKKHASDLAGAYFDIDNNHSHTIGIIGIAAIMPIVTYFGIDWLTVTAVALVLGNFLTAPKALSEFIPKAEIAKM